MPQLTPHFSLEELTVTGTGLSNVPGPFEKTNLQRLAHDLLEPARAHLGVGLRVNSGYRSVAVNKAVKGSGWLPGQPVSAHVFGRAADVFPVGDISVEEAFLRLRASDLPFDKLIVETKHELGGLIQWLHLQIAPDGKEPRRIALMANVDHTGNATYAEVSRG